MNINDTTRYNLVICHNDPLKSIGGTELYVQKKNRFYLTKQIHSVTIFINKSSKKQRSKGFSKYTFGINIDEENIKNHISLIELELYLKQFITENQINNIYYENFYNWINYKKSLNVIYDITKNSKARKVMLLHDTLFRCPKTLLYVQDNYCGAGEKNFKIINCYFCKNGGVKIMTNKILFRKFFQLCDDIICPSTYIQKLFCRYFKDQKFLDKLQVIGHLSKELTNTTSNSKPTNCEEKIKIAFLGNNHKNKGFDDFIKLSQNSKLQKHYKFYIIGNKYDDPNITNIEVSYNNPNNSITGSTISDVLYQEKINLAFLFSKMPESYSFTMHESDTSGVAIITNKNSGNINYQIDKQNIYGISFSDSTEVETFLENKQKVYNFIVNNPSNVIKRISFN